jgi:hypothetical protein
LFPALSLLSHRDDAVPFGSLVNQTRSQAGGAMDRRDGIEMSNVRVYAAELDGFM